MPKCKTCKIRASFGFPNRVAEYCKVHKHEGMVNVLLKKEKKEKTKNHEEELPKTLKDMKEYVEKYTDMFHWACNNGILDNLVKVIEKGIDLEDRRDDKHTGLVAACSHGYEKLVDLLLKSGAKDHYKNNKGDFVYGLIAASKNKASIIKLFINYECPLNVKDKDGRTALMIASDNHILENVKLLIEGGANVNLTDKDGWTALMYLCKYYDKNEAVIEERKEICNLLIDKGAKVNHITRDRGSDGMVWSALWCACRKETNGYLVNILIKAGADTKIRNEDDDTMLMHSSQRCYLDIVKVLLEGGAGAQINAQNKKNGNTALIYASNNVNLNLNIVKVLLNAGADINIQNKDGNTALMCACKYNSEYIYNLPVVKVLLEAGADIFIKNKDGNTALMIAEAIGNLPIVEELKKAAEIKNKN